MGGMRKKNPQQGPGDFSNEKKQPGKGTQEPSKKTNREEARKPAKLVRCVLLNGSAWCTWKGTRVRTIIFEFEHRMRKEELWRR